MNMARNNDTGGDIVMRLAVGAEACDDGIGTVCVRDRGDGFEVFINAGTLPGGRDCKDFGSGPEALQCAIDYALRVFRELIAEQVEA